MASVLTNWFGNMILANWLVKYGAWVGLHEGDPGVTGDLTAELVGGGYVRQQVLFNPATSKSVVSHTKLIWSALPAGVVTHLSLNDTMVTGDMYMAIELGTPVTLAADSQYIIPAHDLAVLL